MQARGKRSGVVYSPLPPDLIGRGAEGAVYRHGTLCLKLLDKPLDTKDGEAIEVLIRHGWAVSGFAWPVELLVHPTTNAAVGFSLPFVPGKSLEAALDARETLRWSTDTKVGIALAVARAVQNAHALTGPTLVLGDTLKPGNILVHRSAVTFIDTGSVNVFGYRSADGSLAARVSGLSTPGYVPAELLDNPAALPDESSDRFALAVTLFETVFGRHPADPKPTPGAVGLDPDDLVRRGLFLRYVSSPEFVPPTYDPVAVPAEVEALFRTAFLARPDQRPTATDWVAALTRWRGRLLIHQLGLIVRPIVWAYRAVETPLLAVVVAAAVMTMAVPIPAGRVERPTAVTLPPAPLPTPLPAKPAGPPLYRELFR